MPVDPNSARAISTQSGTWPGSPRAVPPPPAGDAIDKQLLKRSLFPRRATPVRIGRFTVLDTIGRGGMGVVYACYDDDLDRKVAVKLLHTGSASPELGQRRLLREAQAMARLSHPNIVQVHAVGQEHGRIHIAMEFVRGRPLDAWALAEPRPWRDVLAVLVQAGRGLEAAHRAGLVHRDFKPQNVLVGDDGVVKVLDFGLARAADDASFDEPAEPDGEPDPAEDRPLRRTLTRTGQVLGTPLYMSPEQHRGERATAASDQFSFCMSLYQCLYGVLPFAVDSLGALLEDQRHGRIAPPPARSPVPRCLFEALRRGLSTDPRARFASMTELLAALARDPAARWRRTAALAAMAATIGAASFTAASTTRAPGVPCPDARPALAGIWDDARREQVLRALPDAPIAEVVRRLDRYADAWVHMRGEACLAHAEGRQSTHLFDLRTACLEQRRASLDTLAGALVTADAAALDGVLQAAAELPPLDRCADVEALSAGIAPPDDPVLRARVQAHREALARAQVHEDAGQYQRGRALVDGVLADADAGAYRPLRAEALLRRGSLELEAGAPEAAEASLSAALWTAIAAGHDAVAAQASSKRAYVTVVGLGEPAAAADEPLTTALNRRVLRDIELYAEYLNNIGVVAAAAGDLPTARRRFEEAQALRERHGRSDTPKALETLGNLGWVARAEGRHEDMVALYGRVATLSRQLLGPDHALHLRHLWLRSDGLRRIGRAGEALTQLRELSGRLHRAESGSLRGMILHDLATVELEEGELDAARRHFADALALIPEASENHHAALTMLMRLAAAEGDAAATQAAYERARRPLPEPLDLQDRRARWLLYERGRALTDLGRLAEATEPLRQLQAALAAPEHALERADATLLLGGLLRHLGELDAAERELSAALADRRRLLPPRSVAVADALLELGELALQHGRDTEAAERLTEAQAIYAEIAEPDHPELARTRFALARARTGASTTVPADARALVVQALAAARARSREPLSQAITAWLAARG